MGCDSGHSFFMLINESKEIVSLDIKSASMKLASRDIN